jgi:hypothetical protein
LEIGVFEISKLKLKTSFDELHLFNDYFSSIPNIHLITLLFNSIGSKEFQLGKVEKRQWLGTLPDLLS